MALTFKVKNDQVIAKWERSSVTFMHCIRKGESGIFSTTSTGPRLPYSVYTKAVSEARRLLNNKEKPVQNKERTCTEIAEQFVVTPAKRLDAYRHEQSLTAGIPEHDR